MIDEPASAGRGQAGLSGRAAAALLVATVAFVGFGLGQAWTDGPTFDEATELTSALTVLTRLDLRATPQHPPLFRTVAAAPVLALRPYIPRGGAWERGSGHDLAAGFMHHEAERGRLQRELFAARVLPVLECAAIAWMLALLTSRLFGGTAGLFAGLLWLVNPFVIGIGHLDGIDMPATFTTVLLALAVLQARQRPTGRHLVLVGVGAGLAILARLTGLLLLVAAVAAVTSPQWRSAPRRALRQGAAMAAVAWLTVMVVYGALSPGDIARGVHGVAGVATALAHMVVPPRWLQGTKHLLRVGDEPGPAFVLGRAHTGRWWWFWPASLVVKLPPTTLLVLVAAPLAWLKLARDRRREAAWVVVLPAAMYTLFTLQQQRPIGLRYLLPALALWIVAAAPIVNAVGPPVRRAVVGATVTVGLAATLLITPSLAWTDPLLGEGYQVATDSNLDWGQSYPELRRWSARYHPWVAYFGAGGLTVDTIPGARDLADAPDDLTGWVAVSASLLTAYDRDGLAWLRAYCPVDVLERTVLLYRFVTPPIRSRSGPEAPRPPCAGAPRWSSPG